MHLNHAVLLLCLQRQCLLAGRGCSGATDGSHSQCWLPWFCRIICSWAGRLMGLLTVICNPAGTTSTVHCYVCMGLGCSKQEGMGRELILSWNKLKQQEKSSRLHCREKREEKKPNTHNTKPQPQTKPKA